MEIKETYISKDKKYSIINFETDYRAEEEYGIVDVYKSINNGSFTCELEQVKAFNKTIPVLVINKHKYYEKENNILKDTNNGQAYNKIKYARGDFNAILEHIKENHLDKSMSGIVDENEDNLYFGNNPFIASFYHGETIVIAPNPFYTYLPLNYFKKNTKGYKRYILKKNYFNEETMTLFKDNANKMFKDNCSFINSVYDSFIKNGVLKAPANTPFSTGGYFFFVPKDVIEFTNKNSVFPLEFIDDELVEKDKESLDKEVLEMQIYEKEHKKAIKELNKVKKKLDKQGLKYFSLQTAKKFDDGTWMYWLNPYDQKNNHFGWVTLQDLKDWLNGKGKIILNK